MELASRKQRRAESVSVDRGAPAQATATPWSSPGRRAFMLALALIGLILLLRATRTPTTPTVASEASEEVPLDLAVLSGTDVDAGVAPPQPVSPPDSSSVPAAAPAADAANPPQDNVNTAAPQAKDGAASAKYYWRPSVHEPRRTKWCDAQSCPANERDRTSLWAYHQMKQQLAQNVSVRHKCTYPITIGLEDGYFYAEDWFGPITQEMIATLDQCTVPCFVRQKDHADVKSSDIKLVAVGGEGVPRGHPDQKLAVFSLESAWWQHDPKSLKHTDILISYSRFADVPVNYAFFARIRNASTLPDPPKLPDECNLFPRKGLLNMNVPATMIQRDDKAVSMSMIHKCDDKRKDWLGALMKRLVIHSYGACLHTEGLITGGAGKLQRVVQYPFFISMENEMLDDYITEKFYQGFCTENLLVYIGAPNIADYAPGPKSFVNAHDFGSVDELADYLLTHRD
eukprot:TRINITY_DN3866_c0_g1_i1.p1 TRINITY_DN3866_c0_g1~~TRINITY_DN3866_c0_g1_i1.p1  ORF type:complete len:456 (+),score=144.48 TRINITY_DN3866_c0_g1_i1:1352-2719(+)